MQDQGWDWPQRSFLAACCDHASASNGCCAYNTYFVQLQSGIWWSISPSMNRPGEGEMPEKRGIDTRCGWDLLDSLRQFLGDQAEAGDLHQPLQSRLWAAALLDGSGYPKSDLGTRWFGLHWPAQVCDPPTPGMWLCHRCNQQNSSGFSRNAPLGGKSTTRLEKCEFLWLNNCLIVRLLPSQEKGYQMASLSEAKRD